MRCSTLRGTFCSLISLATPRQDWTGCNPSRREGVGCGFTLSRSHSCCAVLLVYIQISPGHIWTTLYLFLENCRIVIVDEVTELNETEVLRKEWGPESKYWNCIPSRLWHSCGYVPPIFLYFFYRMEKNKREKCQSCITPMSQAFTETI